MSSVLIDFNHNGKSYAYFFGPRDGKLVWILGEWNFKRIFRCLEWNCLFCYMGIRIFSYEKIYLTYEAIKNLRIIKEPVPCQGLTPKISREKTDEEYPSC